MIQKDKELLLKDLCERLPHKVKVHLSRKHNRPEEDIVLNNIIVGKDNFITSNIIGYNYLLSEIKPYLRPLSSMTEEEKKDILQLLNIHGDIDNEGNLLLGVECNIVTLKVCKKYLGELNKRMFDVCHMIEKGLALRAPKGIYINNK